MCGIAGIYKRGNTRLAVDIDKLASELLDGIDIRGGHACGLGQMDRDGLVAIQKASCRSYTFNKHRRPVGDNARAVILHTRFATQGEPAFPENNHPVNSGSVWLVHNGHIENDTALMKLHRKTRLGQVDSEALAAVLSRHWEDPTAALENVEGAFAFAAINERYPNQLLLGRGNASPLNLLVRPGSVTFASTAVDIQEAWKETTGKRPNFNSIEYVFEGTLIRLDGNAIEETRFTPKVPAWMTDVKKGWQAGKWTAEQSKWVSPIKKLVTPKSAKDSAEVFTASTTVDNAWSEQCVACLEWFDYDEGDWIGKQFTCQECFDILSEENWQDDIAGVTANLERLKGMPGHFTAFGEATSTDIVPMPNA